MFIEMVASSVPNGADTQVGEQQHEQKETEVGGVAALDEEEREDRHREGLDDEQEDEIAGRLGEEDRHAVDRAQQQPVETLLVLLLGERAVQAEQRPRRGTSPRACRR